MLAAGCVNMPDAVQFYNQTPVTSPWAQRVWITLEEKRIKCNARVNPSCVVLMACPVDLAACHKSLTRLLCSIRSAVDLAGPGRSCESSYYRRYETVPWWWFRSIRHACIGWGPDREPVNHIPKSFHLCQRHFLCGSADADGTKLTESAVVVRTPAVYISPFEWASTHLYCNSSS